MRLRIVSVITLVCVLGMGAVYADVGDQIPVGQLTATASDYHLAHLPSQAVDGSGMLGDAHVFSWGSWISKVGGFSGGWLSVDLGGTYNIGDVVIYNLNEGWGWDGYGYRLMDVYVSTVAAPGNPTDNPENWILVLDDAELNRAPGNGPWDEPDDPVIPYDYPDVVNLGGAKAAHVTFVCVENFVGANHAGLSEVRFFEGVPPIMGQASDPDPKDEDTGVAMEKVLSWTIGDDPNVPGVPNPDVMRHFVFMSDGTSEDLDIVDTVDASAETRYTYTPVTYLDRDAVYYWRVDEGLADNPAGDPNNIIGKVWSFETVLSTPILDPEYPADTFVHPLEDAVLEVIATNPFGDDNDLSYQWYKYVDGTNDTPLDGTGITSILTISNTGDDDDGEYYCIVTINSNSAQSASEMARVTLKRLVHWKLDETFADESGMHIGSAYGDPNFVDGLVDSGSAIDLNGSNDAVVVSHSDSLNENNFTVSAWARVAGGSGTFRALISARNDAPWSGLMIYATESNKWEFWTGTGTTMDQLGAVVADTDVVEDQWVHVVASFEMTGATDESLVGTKKLYINGFMRAEKADTSFVPNGVTDLLIGAGANETPGYDFFFNGQIDDCQIYNYALDATEVGLLYSNVQGSFCVNKPLLDYSDNCIVDLADFAIFAQSWMECGMFPECVNTIE